MTVQASSTYLFTFTPSHSLVTSSQIVISLPQLVSPGSQCFLSALSNQISAQSATCAFVGQTIVVSNVFTTNFTGGQPLTVGVGSIINPQSAKAPGTFTLSTYIISGGQSYLVDTGSSTGGMPAATPGLISKYTSILASPSVTYQSDVVLTFSLQFAQAVPTGGRLIVILPQSGEVSIAYPDSVSSFCNTTARNLTCQTLNSNSIQISIDRKGFTTSGIGANSVIQFSIKGFLNPRSTQPTSSFNITSYDSAGDVIASSTLLDLPLQVTLPNNITYMSLSQANGTNGATTAYTFVLISVSPIGLNDQLTLTFPSQTSITSKSTSCALSQPANQPSNGITCIATGQTLTVTFSKITGVIASQVQFTVQGIKNPSSLQPSDPFSNIQIMTSQGYAVSQYRMSSLNVRNNNPAILSVFSISQSNKIAQNSALYTITFTPINPIPSTGSILINIPTSMKVVTNQAQCTITLTMTMNNLCKVTSQSIAISGAFQGLQPYQGSVKISFNAVNPMTNQDLQSISLQTFSDGNLVYLMDQTYSGLVPSLQCNYPCQLCSSLNPDYCVSCFQTDLLPPLLQPMNSTMQTCVSQCNSGYTQNGTKNPPTCVQCSPQCSTCAQTGAAGDVNRCLSCSQGYPLSYPANQSCYASCPDGTYACGKSQCCNCLAPCKTCSSTSTCLSCLGSSLLWGSKCVSTCPSGFTQFGAQCVQCQSPCATCTSGAPTSCLSCDSSQGKQFLFGRDCLSVCPAGTTTIMSGNQSYCKGCQQGCDLCSNTDNSQCLRCSKGLALFNYSCYSTCPFNYEKSADGSVCELSLYLLDKSLVYYPFASAAVALLAISISSFVATKGRSLVISNSIALLSLAEVSSLIFQTYQSYVSKRSYKIITVASFALLLMNAALNIAFLLFYCLKLQNCDRSYNHWRQKNVRTVATLVGLSSLVSFKLFRLIYSRLFGIAPFSAAIETKFGFPKRIQIFGYFSIVFFSLPLIALDAVVLYYLPWGSQLYITCGESGGLALIIALLTVFDNCCACSRLPDECDDGKLDDESDPKNLKFQRQRLLRNLIATVEYNKDLTNIESEVESDDEYPKRKRFHSHEPESVLERDDRSVASYHYGESHKRARRKRKERFKKKYGIGKRLPPEIEYVSFSYNNVYAEGAPMPDKNPDFAVEIEIQTDEIDHYGLIKRSKSRLERQLDDIIPEITKDEDETALEMEASINNELKHLKERVTKGKNRGQATKQSYMAQADSESGLNISAYNDEDTSQRRLFAGSRSSSVTKSIKSKKTSSDKTEKTILKSKRSGSVKKRTLSSKKLSLSSRRKSIKSSRSSQKSSEEDQAFINSLFQLRGRVPEKELFHQRSFNILDIMGDFRDDDVRQGEEDAYGRAVNQKGYLIDANGSVINKYNYNIMFDSGELTAEGDLPQPYRLESLNFNPHEIMGHFDYDLQSLKPVILKSRLSGKFVDKHLRPVNKFGFLVDDQGNIVNNDGKVRMLSSRLRSNGDFPLLLNYEALSFDIRTIVGIFDRDPFTKEITFGDSQHQLVDKVGRRVNKAGYLVDKEGNIVYKGGNKIVFQQSHLLFNEPPKIFDFTKLDLEELKEQAPLNMDLYAMTISEEGGPLVNCCGYRTDSEGNIIDRKGDIVLRITVLDLAKDAKGRMKKAQIPQVFLKYQRAAIDQKDFLKEKLELIQERLAGATEQEPDPVVEDALEKEDSAPRLDQQLREPEVQREIQIFNGSLNQIPSEIFLDRSVILSKRPTKQVPPKHMKTGLLAFKAVTKTPTAISSYLPKKQSLYGNSNSTVRLDRPSVKVNMLIQKTEEDTGPYYNDDSELDDNDSVFEVLKPNFDFGTRPVRSKSQQRLTKNYRMYDMATTDVLRLQRKTPQVEDNQQARPRLNIEKLQGLQNIYSKLRR